MLKSPLVRNRFDALLISSLLLLSVIGIVMLISIRLGEEDALHQLVATQEVYRQILFLFLGVVLFLVLNIIDYRIIRNNTVVLTCIAIFLLITVLLTGSTVRGTRGWFSFNLFVFQPVELAKVVFCLALARFLESWARHIHGLKPILMSLGLTVIFSSLVMAQPDAGSAVLFMLVWLSSILFVGIPRRYIITMIIVGMFSAWIIFVFVLKPYQRERLITFVSPQKDVYSQGYHVNQSLIAVGSGGLFGKGFALGSQSQLQFLPERQNDFIFAVFAEEFGFVGVIVILTLWILVLWRLWRYAQTFTNEFAMFYTIAVLFMLLWEVMITVGMNMGVLPVTGLTLPFVSYGGSSFVMHAIMVGIVASMAANRGFTYAVNRNVLPDISLDN